MSPDMDNVEFARENEEFADELENDFPNRKNWIVTIRFYSLLHYIEQRLQAHGYSSQHHNERKENIEECRYTDNRLRNLYRRLEDVSKDARYECIRLETEDVEMSLVTLEEAKSILGYSGDEGGDTKYSI